MLLGGCSITHIQSQDGGIDTKWSLFRPKIEIIPKTQPTIVESKGLGFLKAGPNFTLGYFDSWMAVVPPNACFAIIWFENSKSLDAVWPLLDNAVSNDVCAISEKPAKENSR